MPGYLGEEVLPDGLHRVCCQLVRAGVGPEQVHVVERWRLAVWIYPTLVDTKLSLSAVAADSILE